MCNPSWLPLKDDVTCNWIRPIHSLSLSISVRFLSSGASIPGEFCAASCERRCKEYLSEASLEARSGRHVLENQEGTLKS
jgi:hypothetical protein